MGTTGHCENLREGGQKGTESYPPGEKQNSKNGVRGKKVEGVFCGWARGLKTNDSGAWSMTSSRPSHTKHSRRTEALEKMGAAFASFTGQPLISNFMFSLKYSNIILFFPVR